MCEEKKKNYMAQEVEVTPGTLRIETRLSKHRPMTPPKPQCPMLEKKTWVETDRSGPHEILFRFESRPRMAASSAIGPAFPYFWSAPSTRAAKPDSVPRDRGASRM